MKSIRAVTWLAPGIPLSFFERVRKTLQEQLDVPVFLESRTKLSGPAIGSSDPFGDGDADLGFLCAPAAVPSAVRRRAGFELLELAPLFDDVRYAGRPICFCDIVVRQDTPGSGLSDLQGAILGYNDTSSLSGWLGLQEALRERQTLPEHFFGERIQTGGHLSSLDQLRSGAIQAASIDSNVLHTHPGSMRGLRVIDSLGPWPSQPVVVRASLEARTKERITGALTQCGPWPQWRFIGFRRQEARRLEQVPTAPTS